VLTEGQFRRKTNLDEMIAAKFVWWGNRSRVKFGLSFTKLNRNYVLFCLILLSFFTVLHQNYLVQRIKKEITQIKEVVNEEGQSHLK